MVRSVRWILVSVGLILISHPASGVSPQVWQTSGVDGWTATLREGVALDSEGSVRLSLTGTPVEGVDAFAIWDLLPDGDGVIAATGDGGVLYRISRDGTAREVATVLQPEITALGRDGEGTLLFGAAPDGMLYRLTDSGAEPVIDTPESYIWQILPRGKSGAWVLTGNDACVYRLEGRELTRVAELDAVHITGGVVVGEDLIITTDSPGRLVRVNGGSGALEVLYEADRPELRSPVLTADGTLYCLANPQSGNGSILRRLPSGGVETVWEAPAGLLFRLLADGPDALMVSMGGDTGQGSVVRLHPNPPSTWSEILSVDEPQISALAQGTDGAVWVGTGGLGRVYRAGQKPDTGSVMSDVHDAQGISRWGALSVNPSTLSGGVKFESRSGNTLIPDDAWSSWSTVTLASGRGGIQSPAARFLQWKLTLSSADPVISNVSVAYLPTNLSPQVREVVVSELGLSFDRSLDGQSPSSLSQLLPGGVRVDFQIPGFRSNGEASDEQAGWARRFRTLTWKASDPNDDPLEFAIHLQPITETSWYPIGEEIEGAVWVWDSSSVPDGWYRVRVTASDQTANPPGEAGASDRVSDVFLVDNTAPQLTDLRVAGGQVEGVAEDAASTIASISYAVDGGNWQSVFPSDGIPDMPREAFLIPIDTLTPGTHLLLVRATDAAGNMGSSRVEVKRP